MLLPVLPLLSDSLTRKDGTASTVHVERVVPVQSIHGTRGCDEVACEQGWEVGVCEWTDGYCAFFLSFPPSLNTCSRTDFIIYKNKHII